MTADTSHWHDRFPRLEIERRNITRRPLPRCRYRFPNPAEVAAEGAATVGADFAPATLVRAYRSGYFPWPHEDVEFLWFSPDPRAVLPLGGLHVSHSLARLLRRLPFRLTMDTAFEDIVAGCARRAEGTWITPAYMRGYASLHVLGWAHSFEVWDGDGRLAGGLYGLRVGNLFGAESMFHRVTGASKVAMAAMMQWAEDEGIALIDVQVTTPHTERMGAIEIPRADYLARLAEAIRGWDAGLPGAPAADTVGSPPGTSA